MHPRLRISAVIPAWNEAAGIEAAVRSALVVADEVVVADAGSPDGTSERAAKAGAVVVTSEKGRGAQLDAGAAKARFDVLLFLHADARLPGTARPAIEAALADEAVLGGNFRLRFEPDGAWAGLFSWANDVRRRRLGIYYGDSALFLRRRTFDALGGFGPLPIMEDYALIRRLERMGPTAYIRDVEVTVSARRFEAAPVRTAAVWALVQGLYSAGVPAEKLSRLYADIR